MEWKDFFKISVWKIIFTFLGWSLSSIFLIECEISLPSSLVCDINRYFFAIIMVPVNFLFSEELGVKSAIIPLPESAAILPPVLFGIFEFLWMYLLICFIFWIVGKLVNKGKQTKIV